VESAQGAEHPVCWVQQHGVQTRAQVRTTLQVQAIEAHLQQKELKT
jgi:hypothetical protein